MAEKSITVAYLPLESWNRHWTLIGTQVQCKACNALQEGGNAFRHGMQCSAHTASAQYPMRKLHQILRDRMDQGLA